MKKLLSLTLAAALTFSFASCGKKDENDTQNTAKNEQAQQEEQAKKAATLTPDEYLDYIIIEKNDIAGSLKMVFDELKKQTGDTASDGKLTLSVGDGTAEFIDAIDSEAGEYYRNSLGWLKYVSLDLDANIKSQDLMSLAAQLGINGTNIVTLDFIASLAKGEFYFTIPELSSKTALVKVPESALAELEMSMDLSDSNMDILPDGAAAERMYTKYTGIVLDNITEVEKTDAQVTVGSVTADTNRVFFEIDERLANEMAIDIVEAALTDEDLKNIIGKISEANYQLAGFESAEMMTMDAYADMQETLADLKEKQSKNNFSDDTVGITIHTNKLDEISCIDVTADSESLIKYNYVEKDGAFALEFYVGKAKYFEGRGTIDDDKMAGNFSVLNGDSLRIANIALVDLDLASIEHGMTNGKVTATLAPEFIFAMDMPEYIGNCELVIVFNQAEETASAFTMTLDYNGRKAFELYSSSKEKQSGEITIPAEALDLNSENGVNEFLSSMNLNTILTNLSNADASQLIALFMMGS